MYSFDIYVSHVWSEMEMKSGGKMTLRACLEQVVATQTTAERNDGHSETTDKQGWRIELTIPRWL